MAFSKMAGLDVMPLQAVFLNVLFQLTAAEHVAPDVVQPDRLAVVFQFLQWIHDTLSCLHLRVSRLHFRQTAEMPLLASKFGVQKSMSEFTRGFCADHASAKHQNVHIVVFHALMRGINIMAEPGAYSHQLVCRDRGAHATAANQDASFGIPARTTLSTFSA